MLKKLKKIFQGGVLMKRKLDLTFKSSLVVTFSKEFLSCTIYYLHDWYFLRPNMEK